MAATDFAFRLKTRHRRAGATPWLRQTVQLQIVAPVSVLETPGAQRPNDRSQAFSEVRFVSVVPWSPFHFCTPGMFCRAENDDFAGQWILIACPPYQPCPKTLTMTQKAASMSIVIGLPRPQESILFQGKGVRGRSSHRLNRRLK
ncbi:hypothetical protein [Rhizobium mongolense]|uniref:Uncharacterized protein n=1 Tax=Rhizobium mongolense TaxID=57676 RepID=A0A7W6WBM1_9HYPH|nr:hypothetical protein [Rhizobium mongolense]MBB4272422.1 hypothetical protein [Rhizobium mongolense]